MRWSCAQTGSNPRLSGDPKGSFADDFVCHIGADILHCSIDCVGRVAVGEFIKCGFGIGVGVDEYGNDDGPDPLRSGRSCVLLVFEVLRAVRLHSAELDSFRSHQLVSLVG